MEENLEKNETTSENSETVEENVEKIETSEESSFKEQAVVEAEQKSLPVKEKDRFKAIKITWKIIKTILIVCLVLVFAVIVVQRVSKNKATIGGYGLYTIVSESMVPEYNIWDMLFAKRVDVSTINVGDDVVYQGTKGDFVDKIVTHRVIKKSYDGTTYHFITQGIANPVEDPEITGDQIYGKVVYKSVVLTTISKVINTTYGFYFIIFVPFVLIVTFEIIDTVNERKRLQRS